MRRTELLLGCILLASAGCHSTQEDQRHEGGESLFVMMDQSVTNIDFSNELTSTEAFNTYSYRNFYNGGGVAIGDVNNDGLPDIFFCGNMVSNRLYLNQGDFKFRDVTDESGLSTKDIWSTGVSMADVNGDGWLDIFVCKSGKPEGERRHNELFINKGISDEGDFPVFEDQSKKYGIADYGHSTHAAFFDFDKDSDLDMYLLNNSLRAIGNYDLRKNQREIRNPEGGNKLYRNDDSVFTDISEEAGIYGSAIGFGLGVTIADIDRDGWQDIFISNDFFERDYLYLNQHDGTFRENLVNIMGEISLGSMGADIGDINNDGLPEIFVTEMLPREEGRLKTKAIFEDWDKYQANQSAGYHHQFPRNALQLNHLIPGDSQQIFMSEISRYAGVDATDWSWGALIADLDNDGFKDLFVANGIFRDLTDLDYINFYANPYTTQRLYEERGTFLMELIDKIPSTPISNFAFHNNGDLTFADSSANWGLDSPGFSNGSAYGDLDNDGDLDLVISNVNMEPFVYKNTTVEKNLNHFLSLTLTGSGKNTHALGAQVTVFCGKEAFYQELAPMRGYQSSVDPRLHFGLGKHEVVDSIQIIWPDESLSMIYSAEVDSHHTFSQKEAIKKPAQKLDDSDLPLLLLKHDFTRFTDNNRKSDFIDFKRDPLLFHMLSAEGSNISLGDVNGDGLEDIFFGGSAGNPGELYYQNSSGSFSKAETLDFEDHKASHDAGSAIFDADGDGDMDLYVASGGNEFPSNSSTLADRLYINNGNGVLTNSGQALPTLKYQNTSTVRPHDFDGDGDIDLFVGERAKPFQYGIPCDGYLLQNDGNGLFTNVTEELAPELLGLGMITDAQWIDYDNDQDADLAIVGDWMPVTVFTNDQGTFKDITHELGLDKTNGLWNCIETADVNNDGKPDLIAGNLGLNARLKASKNQPLTMYINDFDNNGSFEQIITMYFGDNAYPLIRRDELIQRLPGLKKKYLKYADYRNQTIDDIFEKSVISNSTVLNVFTTESTVFVNSDGQFLSEPLPPAVQMAPVYAIHIEDFNGDDIPDIFSGGNFYWSKPEIGIYDASRGNIVSGLGDGRFEYVEAKKSGVHIPGEVRNIVKIKRNSKDDLIVVSRLNEYPLVFIKAKETAE